MKKSNKKNNKINNWLKGLDVKDYFSFIFIYIFFMIIVYYIISPGKLEFHSDCTDTIMWANATFQSGKLINPDFKYACILPFGGNILMLLFMPFFGLSYTTHCLGMILFTAIFIVSIVVMLRKLKFTYPMCAASVFSMIFVLSGSAKLREIFWGHIIYYSQGILFLIIGLTLMFKILDMVDEKNYSKGFYITGIILGVFVALTATNGIQALTIFILPFVGGILGERLLNTKIKLLGKESVFIYKYTFIILICMIAGMGIVKLISGDVTGGYEDAYSKFSSSSEWLESLNNTFVKWFTLLGVDIENGDDILSIKSIFNIVKIIFGTILPIIPLYMLFNYNKIEDRYERIILIAHWCSTIFIMIGWIFGKISSANWRLSPIICTSMLVLIIFIGNMFKNIETRRIAVIFALPVLVVSLQSVTTVFKLDTDFESNTKYKAMELIKRNNLSYGYGTFWNANALTVLSNDEIKVRNVQINNNNVEPYYYQSFYSWYENQEGVDRYFLLLTESEYTDLLNNNNDLLNKCVSMDSSDGYFLLIFDKNIF